MESYSICLSVSIRLYFVKKKFFFTDLCELELGLHLVYCHQCLFSHAVREVQYGFCSLRVWVRNYTFDKQANLTAVYIIGISIIFSYSTLKAI